MRLKPLRRKALLQLLVFFLISLAPTNAAAQEEELAVVKGCCVCNDGTCESDVNEMACSLTGQCAGRGGAMCFLEDQGCSTPCESGCPATPTASVGYQYAYPDRDRHRDEHGHLDADRNQYRSHEHSDADRNFDRHRDLDGHQHDPHEHADPDADQYRAHEHSDADSHPHAELHDQ